MQDALRLRAYLAATKPVNERYKAAVKTATVMKRSQRSACRLREATEHGVHHVPLEVKNCKKNDTKSSLAIDKADTQEFTCGDSYFTKQSSCSFDRAAYSPNDLLNPLHSSIKPVGQEPAAAQQNTSTTTRPKPRPRTTGNQSAMKDAKSSNGEIFRTTTAHTDVYISSATSPTESDMSAPDDVHLVPCERKAKTGEVITGISFSEIGKASRFGDKTLAPEARCTVFEVVLQSREATMCPACARNPQRARLPARKWHVRSTA